MKRIEVIGFKNIYSSYSLVFKIFTHKKGNVFVRIDSGLDNHNKYIVFLDTNKFTGILASKGYFYSDTPLELPENQKPWIKPKIEQCIEGFRNSCENPVPLSTISFYDDEVRFTDGITRMSWLVANEAEIIPVQTDIHSIQKLQELFGADNYKVKTIQEYLEEYQSQ